MTNAACVVRHSRKLRNVQNILRDKPAILARRFSKEAFSSNNTGDDILKIQHGNFHGKKDGRFLGGNPHILNSSAKVLSIFTISRTTKSSSTTGSVFSTPFLGSKVSFRRGFSTSVVVPKLLRSFLHGCSRASSTSRTWNAFSFSYNDRGKHCTMVEKRR